MSIPALHRTGEASRLSNLHGSLPRRQVSFIVIPPEFLRTRRAGLPE